MYVDIKRTKYVFQSEEKTRREDGSCIVEIHLARVNLAFMGGLRQQLSPACGSSKLQWLEKRQLPSKASLTNPPPPHNTAGITTCLFSLLVFLRSGLTFNFKHNVNN
jgi:hypothetical protein